MFFNKLIGGYGCFPVLLLLVDAGSCKNARVARSIDLLIKNQAQKNSNPSHTTAVSQQDNIITAEGNSENKKNHALQIAEGYPHKNSKEDVKQMHQADAQPSFSLKNITTKAGTQQSTMLEATGITKGYSIKSISVSQNRSYYTNKFKVDVFKNKPIPPSGLPITLTPDLTLKAGSYTLKIRISKTGKNSRQTEQWVICTIHVTKNKKNNPWKGLENR